MNKNVLIVLVGGFLVAILVAMLVQASLGGKKQVDTGPQTYVLVAAKDLALGAELKEGDLKWQAWPGVAFDGAILRKANETATEALKGRLVARVSVGQPVLQSYIFKEGKGNLVAATLGKGMRAMAIPVKADTMAGGFISPGDFVDVILSYNISLDGEQGQAAQSVVNKAASETILRNIRVLAVDQDAARSEDKAKIARTVTLEVPPAGVEKLALASTMGDLTLSLRGLGDDAVTPENTTTTDLQVGKIMSDIVRESNGPANSVRIYNGVDVQDVRTRNAGMPAIQNNNAVEGEQR